MKLVSGNSNVLTSSELRSITMDLWSCRFTICTRGWYLCMEFKTIWRGKDSCNPFFLQTEIKILRIGSILHCAFQVFSDQERQTSCYNAAFLFLAKSWIPKIWSDYTLSYIESSRFLVKLRHRLSFVEFSSNLMKVIVNYQFCFINFEVHFFQTLLKTEYGKQQHCKKNYKGTSITKCDEEIRSVFQKSPRDNVLNFCI